MKLEAWAASNIGRVRKSNQDTVGCFPEQQLFVVADGMGGRSEGEVASRLAVDTLREALHANGERGGRGFWRSLLGGLSAAGEGASNDSDLAGAIELANQRIYAAGQQQTSEEVTQRGTMGTTVVALFCDLGAARAQWAHVGDSRLYRARAGEVALLTADHTLFGEQYWDAPAVPADLPHTNRLVRALGIAPSVQVARRTDALHGGDLFLLCSDGVSGMVAPDELRAMLLAAGPLEAAGAALIQGALDAGGKDNASALLVRVLDD